MPRKREIPGRTGTVIADCIVWPSDGGGNRHRRRARCDIGRRRVVGGWGEHDAGGGRTMREERAQRGCDTRTPSTTVAPAVASARLLSTPAGRGLQTASPGCAPRSASNNTLSLAACTGHGTVACNLAVGGGTSTVRPAGRHLSHHPPCFGGPPAAPAMVSPVARLPAVPYPQGSGAGVLAQALPLPDHPCGGKWRSRCQFPHRARRERLERKRQKGRP